MSWAIKKTQTVDTFALGQPVVREEMFRRLNEVVDAAIVSDLLPNLEPSDKVCMVEVMVKSGTPASWDLTIVHAVTDVSLSAARGTQAWTVVECMGDDCSACAAHWPRALLERRKPE